MTTTYMAFIGCGGMARHHLRHMLADHTKIEVPVVCEPSASAYQETVTEFEKANQPPPLNEPDLTRLLLTYGNQLDAVFIVTPHVYHYQQAKTCLEAGLDVLLEKPMVMSALEAQSLIETRDRTGRQLVVSFQGSLSPQIRTAVSMLRSGELGRLLSISGTIWQDWANLSSNTWRQQPDVSGGGFLFDSGAHLLNTVADLAGEDFVDVAAWFDNQARPVEIVGAIMGRLQSGALVTLNACGSTSPSCSSDLRVFCEAAMLRTDAWGRWLEVQYTEQEGWQNVKVPPSAGVWEQFLAVRQGDIPNPSPPEVGLRMAYLWDAIKASAAQNGIPVHLLTRE